MIKRIIGILFTVAVLAVIVCTILRRNDFRSAFFDGSALVPALSPPAPVDTLRIPLDSMRVDTNLNRLPLIEKIPTTKRLSGFFYAGVSTG